MPVYRRRRQGAVFSDPYTDAAEDMISAKAFTRARLPIDELIDNPKNDNVHPPEQIEMLEATIKRFGQSRPVLARKENRMLIAGHGVRQAMRNLGIAEVDVVLADVDQETADAMLVADNRLAELAHPDMDRRRALLEGTEPDDLASLGFTQAEFDKLFADGEDQIQVIEIDTGEVHDDYWIVIRGPIEHQPATLQRLQDVLRDLPGVSVELGTIPQ